MSLKLLSFVLSFQKRKYIKERGLQEIFVLMIPARLALQTLSVIFSRKCQIPLLGEACKGASHRLHIPPSRRSLQGCSAPLAYPPFSAKPARVLRTACISPFSAKPARVLRTACISPKVGGKKFLCAPRSRRHKSPAQTVITPRGAHLFSSETSSARRIF